MKACALLLAFATLAAGPMAESWADEAPAIAFETTTPVEVQAEEADARLHGLAVSPRVLEGPTWALTAARVVSISRPDPPTRPPRA